MFLDRSDRNGTSKRKKCILVGYEEDSKSYRLFNIRRKTVVKKEGRIDKNLLVDIGQALIGEESAYVELDLVEVTRDQGEIQPNPANSYENFEDANDDEEAAPEVQPCISSNPSDPPMLRRSGRERTPPSKLNDFILPGKGIFFSNFSESPDSGPTIEPETDTAATEQSLVARKRNRHSDMKQTTNDPQTLVEALQSDKSNEWRAAMKEEYAALMKSCGP